MRGGAELHQNLASKSAVLSPDIASLAGKHIVRRPHNMSARRGIVGPFGMLATIVKHPKSIVIATELLLRVL